MSPPAASDPPNVRRSLRFTVDPATFNGIADGDPLPDELVHRVLNVRRGRIGDMIELVDGCGFQLCGTIARQRRAVFLVDAKRTEILAPGVNEIWVLAGLLKANRWKLVVEKSVELGVSRLIPILTERSVVVPSDKTHERWQRIAQQAASQCHRLRVTQIDPPCTLDGALAKVVEAALEIRLVGEARGGAWPQSDSTDLGVAVLIGPEGGLSRDERDLAVAADFRAVSLGGFWLRAETAVVAMVAMARDRLGINLAETQALSESES